MMVPMRRRLRLVPISEITLKARRLSSPVIAMAAAMTSDAAISATAGLVKPFIAADKRVRGAEEMIGLRGIGRNAKQKCHQGHQHDRNWPRSLSLPSSRRSPQRQKCRACAGRQPTSPAGCGSMMMATSAAAPTSNPQLERIGFRGCAGRHGWLRRACEGSGVLNPASVATSQPKRSWLPHPASLVASSHGCRRFRTGGITLLSGLAQRSFSRVFSPVAIRRVTGR